MKWKSQHWNFGATIPRMGNEEAHKPEESAPTPSAPSAQSESKTQGVAAEVEVVPSSGKRRAFKELRRELSEADLSSPGVQKMLLEELQIAEDKCEVLESYVERFHEADKRAGILAEQLVEQKAFDVLFSVSFGTGFAIIGLAPFFWEVKGAFGPILLAVGIVLASGSAAASVARR